MGGGSSRTIFATGGGSAGAGACRREIRIFSAGSFGTSRGDGGMTSCCFSAGSSGKEIFIFAPFGFNVILICSFSAILSPEIFL